MSDNHEPNRHEAQQARLSAYALGQLDADERAAVEMELAVSSDARQFVEEVRTLASGQVAEAARHQPLPSPSASLREQLNAHLDELEASPMSTDDTRPTPAKQTADNKHSWRPWLVAAGLLVLLTFGGAAAVLVQSVRDSRSGADARVAQMREDANATDAAEPRRPSLLFDRSGSTGDPSAVYNMPPPNDQPLAEPAELQELSMRLAPMDDIAGSYDKDRADGLDRLRSQPVPRIPPVSEPALEEGDAPAISGSSTTPHPGGGSGEPNGEDRVPRYSPPRLAEPTKAPSIPLKSPPAGSEPQATGEPATRPAPPPDPNAIALNTGKRPRFEETQTPSKGGELYEKTRGDDEPADRPAPEMTWRNVEHPFGPHAEQYDKIVENPFLAVGKEPESTLSIDVDTASYANVRRFLTGGQLPPPNAVRIEELVNYFKYRYPQPDDQVPFSVGMEVTQCPWQGDHRLLKVGLKGREIDREQRGPSNLVFLLDVSGSMSDDNKLPLVKQAMRLLVQQLTEDDRVAIVTYASNAGLRLESTRGEHQDKIAAAIDSLQAGGSTHGSAGIQLAYEQATRHFVSRGVNRVILCTDGDLNVGITRDDDLVGFIENKAKSGVFLTVLGFGTGNLKDSKMEKLADKGNGVYAYIDSLREARKVLVDQMTGSLVTIAKDVKIQIEFNPAEVAGYRLIGYENRVLARRDFDDDRIDAGEIGAGHTVTALYELIPADSGNSPAGGRPLKYQQAPDHNLTEAARSGELLTLRLRYKEPDGTKSRLLEFALADEGRRFGEASPDFQFAAAVAAFGMILRGSQHAGDATLPAVEEYALGGLGDDPQGYRAEFVDLVRRARQLAPR